jgi:3-phosphoshikimate 1-carboxyvinyltransferase
MITILAFAPLTIKVPIIIENAEVVSKSYLIFWDDLRTIGLHCPDEIVL